MRKRFIALILVFAFFISAPVAFAASNPHVTIVNPVSGSTVYSDNLLVSVKLTAPTSICVSVTQEFKIAGDENIYIKLEDYQNTEPGEIASVAVGDAESFTSANSLSFYTKKVENVTPGVYKITVDTVSTDGKVLFTNSNPVEIKPKEENPPEPPGVESQPSGPAQFLKNLLKIIFKE